MNVVFAVIFILSGAVLLLVDPAGFLPALLDGATKSATLCLALLASYAAWLGLMQLWEESGVARGISKLLKPLCRKLFRTNDEEALSAIGMNLSTNLLGIGGAATPYGIKSRIFARKKQGRALFLLHALRRQRHLFTADPHLRRRPAHRRRQRFRRRYYPAHDARHRVFHGSRRPARQIIYQNGRQAGEKKRRAEGARKTEIRTRQGKKQRAGLR